MKRCVQLLILPSLRIGPISWSVCSW